MDWDNDLVFWCGFLIVAIAVIVGFGLFFSWFDGVARHAETDTATCRSAAITDLVGQSETRSIAHYTYKLDNGERWSSTNLYQDGQRVCIDR